LQKFIAQRLEDGGVLSWIDVIMAQLTIERIRVREVFLPPDYHFVATKKARSVVACGGRRV